MSRVQEIGDLGYFDWHIDTDELYLSDQSYDLLGIHPDSFEHTHEAWLEVVHPADRETVETAIENALDGRGSYSIEFRITTPAGETRYVHEEAEVEFDEDGAPIRMTGAGFDITDQKRLQQERQESLHALQRLYAISSDRTLDFETKVEELLAVGTEYLGLANGFLTRIEEETQHIESAVAEHPELQPGASCPLDEAYCKRTIEMDELLTVVNAADEGWVDDAAYERFELGTYIGGPIQVSDSLYGTVCFADTEPRERPFTDSERVFVELLTRWVSYELTVREFETISNQT